MTTCAGTNWHKLRKEGTARHAHDVGHPFVATAAGPMCLPCYALLNGRESLRIFTGVTRPCEVTR